MGSTRLTGVMRLKTTDPSRALKRTDFSKMLRERFLKNFVLMWINFLIYGICYNIVLCFGFWASRHLRP